MPYEHDCTDIVIVGGGASGLAAAIELRMSSPELGVTVIEKMDRPGRKIRATGSGRCNITNTSADHYIEIMKFFSRIGLVTKVYGNGLVYPHSESAADVAELLISRAEELGVRIIAEAEVTHIARSGSDMNQNGKGTADNHRFRTEYCISSDHIQAKYDPGTRKTQGTRSSKKVISSDYVILSCGGKAGPMFGTTGDGYRLARELGHTIVTPVPVLTPIECKEWDASHIPCGTLLAGTRTRGVVKLTRSPEYESGRGSEIFEEAGEIQFTKSGLSGICVFNMTRHMRYDRSKGESLSDFIVTADLYPDGDIEDFLRERRNNAFPGERSADVLRTVLKENIAEYVMRSVAVLHTHVNEKSVSELTDSDIKAIADSVHGLMFHPEKLRGWKDAQVTSGGVSLEEICPETCESLVSDGLYITGELADRDYPCGGHNLSNAWITGLTAARAISRRQK